MEETPARELVQDTQPLHCRSHERERLSCDTPSCVTLLKADGAEDAGGVVHEAEGVKDLDGCDIENLGRRKTNNMN